MTQSTILIVDDNAANCQTLEDLLDYPEMDLHSAHDGHAALARAAVLLPDLILLDVMMPGMDGFEVCTRLRADPQLAEIPIIMLTALDDRESHLRGINAGADDFLTKPFDRTELRARVRGILRLNRFRRLNQERERADQANDRLRLQATLTDLSPDLVAATDSNRKLLYWSEGAKAITGWDSEAAIGQDFLALLGLANSVEQMEVFRQTAAGNSWQGEFEITTRSGEIRTMLGRWKHIPANARSGEMILLVNSDITELKTTQAKFIQAQRLENIGTLASGIAHDLNNILSPIMMSVTMLRSDLPEQLLVQIIDTIEQSTKRGADIIKQVLSFARGAVPDKVPVSATELAREITNMLGATFPKNITFSQIIHPGAGKVLGDHSQFIQILLNLCVNARDAMPDGGALRLTIEPIEVDKMYANMTNEAQIGRYVLFRIEDTGHGIPAEIIDKIYDPFFTSKSTGKGTGLGLATVHGIVHGHGGFIRCASKVGFGTTFSIYLPAADSSEEQSQAAKSIPPPHGNGEMLLFVDDEPLIALNAQTILEKHGYRVLCAPDGIEGIALFSENRDTIRCVIADVLMPNLDGIALGNIIRHMNPSLPIVFATGLAEEGKLRSIENFGPLLLRKPYTGTALLQIISESLLGIPAPKDPL